MPLLEMPIDFSRLRSNIRSQRDDYPIDQELISQLKKWGQRQDAALYQPCLYRLRFFYRLISQNDIVLGLPAAGQSATGNYAL
jgi:hypothetical protein